MNKQEKEVLDMMKSIMETDMVNGYGFEVLFGGLPNKPKPPYENLNYGYELRPIELKDEEGKPVPNTENYSHLYRDGEQISKEVFRKGGMSYGYKEGYCNLILYVEEKTNKSGFDFGTHVIVDAFGKVVMSGGFSDHPTHVGMHVARMKDVYYNLLNGEKIVAISSSNPINGEKYIIIEHRYDWYNKNLPLGVYKLDKSTCELTKIDNIKK